jgi:DNA repair protein RecO (recombination protein O)
MGDVQRSYRVEAVVLRHSNWGEADRLLVIYTRQYGKLRVIAKGARKVRSRKAGHLEPFTQSSIQLAHSSDLPIVTQAEAMDSFLPLREDLVKTGYASYVVELVDRFTIDSNESVPIFSLIIDALKRIAGDDQPFLAVRYFEIHLLDHVGFRPELFQCVRCRKKIQPEDQYFSFEQGGVLCPECHVMVSHCRDISMAALKVLRHIQRSSFEQAIRLLPDPKVKNEIELIILDYLTYLLERKLHSTDFIQLVRSIKRDP